MWLSSKKVEIIDTFTSGCNTESCGGHQCIFSFLHQMSMVSNMHGTQVSGNQDPSMILE